MSFTQRICRAELLQEGCLYKKHRGGGIRCFICSYHMALTELPMHQIEVGIIAHGRMLHMEESCSTWKKATCSPSVPPGKTSARKQSRGHDCSQTTNNFETQGRFRFDFKIMEEKQLLRDFREVALQEADLVRDWSSFI